VRFKPLYTDYNSRVDQFSKYFPSEVAQLNLEPLPLYDDEATELFTDEKPCTLFHQAQAITALLRGSLPPGYSGGPETLRESLAWYWNNTHYGVLAGFIALLLFMFGFGVHFSGTKLYKKTIASFISEYKTLTEQRK
jgi:hypothetical protein